MVSKFVYASNSYKATHALNREKLCGLKVTAVEIRLYSYTIWSAISTFENSIMISWPYKFLKKFRPAAIKNLAHFISVTLYSRFSIAGRGILISFDSTSQGTLVNLFNRWITVIQSEFSHFTARGEFTFLHSLISAISNLRCFLKIILFHGIRTLTVWR